MYWSSAATLSLLCRGALLDASKCDSGAHRDTRIWQNLLSHDTLAAEYVRFRSSARPDEAAMKRAGLSRWSTHPSPQPGDSHRAQPTTFQGPLPYLGTHPDTAPFRVHNGISGRGMLYDMDTPSTPSAEVKEVLMRFCGGDTAAPILSELQRVQLLGQYTDLNTITWTISTIRQHTSFAEHSPRSTPSLTHRS